MRRKCPKCLSPRVAARKTFDGHSFSYSHALCLACGHRLTPYDDRSDIKVITEAISPAGIPVVVYEKVSTGEIYATPASLFDRGLTHGY